MMRLHHLFLAGALAAAAVPAAAQEGAVQLFVTGGLQTSPADYDTFRPVEYDTGFKYGGGLAIHLTDWFAFRAEIAQGSNGGFEGGVLNEDIQFDRTYFGLMGQATLPVAMIEPYLLAGLGLVTLDREGPSYDYGFTESGGVAGAGVSLPIGTPAVNAFVEGTGWVYPNTSTGEWYFDPVLSIGLGYTIPF